MVKTVAFFLLSAVTGGWAGHFRLPPDAQINIGKTYILPGYDASQETCPHNGPGETVTRAKVRRMFSTYHELKEMESHDRYLQAGCVTDGEVIVRGKKYTFQVQPVNLLHTTWPDGNMHELGGKHSDGGGM